MTTAKSKRATTKTAEPKAPEAPVEEATEDAAAATDEAKTDDAPRHAGEADDARPTQGTTVLVTDEPDAGHDNTAGRPVAENGRVPAVGALEAPAENVPEELPGGIDPVNSGEVGVVAAAEKPHDLIIDSRTGEAPDPDAMFKESDGPGDVLVCQHRLEQIKNPGAGWSSSQLLVMPRGQVVSRDRADQLVALVKAQAADSE